MQIQGSCSHSQVVGGGQSRFARIALPESVQCDAEEGSSCSRGPITINYNGIQTIISLCQLIDGEEESRLWIDVFNDAIQKTTPYVQNTADDDQTFGQDDEGEGEEKFPSPGHDSVSFDLADNLNVDENDEKETYPGSEKMPNSWMEAGMKSDGTGDGAAAGKPALSGRPLQGLRPLNLRTQQGDEAANSESEKESQPNRFSPLAGKPLGLSTGGSSLSKADNEAGGAVSEEADDEEGSSIKLEEDEKEEEEEDSLDNEEKQPGE